MWRGWRCGTCPSRRWRRRGRKTPETHRTNTNWVSWINRKRRKTTACRRTRASVMMVPDADQVKTSIWPGVSISTYLQRSKVRETSSVWNREAEEDRKASSWAENHAGSLNHINWPMILLLLLYELHHLKDTNTHVFFHYSVRFSSWFHQNTSHRDI